MIIEGKPLKPSPIVEREYRKEILAIVKAMQMAVMRVLDGGEVAQDSYPSQVSHLEIQGKMRGLQTRFDRKLMELGQVAAIKWLEKQVNHASRSFVSSVRVMVESKAGSFSLPSTLMNSTNEPFMREIIKENVSLIRTIGEKYFERIEKEVAASFSEGGNMKKLKSAIMEINGQNERRASLIARDQTNKAYGQISMYNMKKAGINKAKWRHSNAGRNPRSYHQTMWDGKSEPPNGLNGYIYNVDVPPVADLKTGERAFPSGLINCRCFATPVIEI